MDVEDLRRRMEAHIRAVKEKARSIPKVAVEEILFSGTVVAVDGGLYFERLHGFDILGVRACAVKFCYEDGSLVSISHHPSKKPPISWEVFEGVGDSDQHLLKSLKRLQCELSCVLEIADSDCFILLDGSLFPLPSDIPSKSSPFWKDYERVASLFNKLHELKTAGVVKDSRASHFGNDALLCHFALMPKERTSEFAYAPSVPLCKKQGWAFYMKCSDMDLPFRVECLEECSRWASLLYFLSFSKTVGYPFPLLEAHNCAHISEKERISLGMEKIRRLGPGFLF